MDPFAFKDLANNFGVAGSSQPTIGAFTQWVVSHFLVKSATW